MKTFIKTTVAVGIGLFIVFLFFINTPEKASASYYQAIYPEQQDTLNNVIDIAFKIDPLAVKSVSLEKLVRFPNCDLESADGFTHGNIQDDINLSDFRYKIIKKSGATVIRLFDNDLQDLNASFRCDECDYAFSGVIKVTPKKGDVYRKTFQILSKDFKSIVIKPVGYD